MLMKYHTRYTVLFEFVNVNKSDINLSNSYKKTFWQTLMSYLYTLTRDVKM